MSGRFIRPAMAVSVRTKYFPFEYGFLEGPGYYDIPPLRVMFHEITHFWQSISTNYLSNVALAEWNSLLSYEKTGAADDIPNISKDLHKKDSSAGFSPNDLLESLSRFWDIHTLGPRKVETWKGLNVDYDLADRFELIKSPTEQIEPYTGSDFDRVMLSENYSAPYQIIHNKLGSFLSVVAFPIISYYSFQSRNPVLVYNSSVNTMNDIVPNAETNSIHQAWRETFFDIGQHVVRTSFDVGAPVALPHSVFPTVASTAGKSDDNALFVHYGNLISEIERRSSAIELDFYFALPGDPKSRGFLIGQLLPPTVLFLDGHWVLNSLLQQQLEKLGNEVTSHEQLADTAKKIHHRYRQFQLATDISRRRSRNRRKS